MIRLTEIKLPLNHDEAALPAAILNKLANQTGTTDKVSVCSNAGTTRAKSRISN